MSISKFRWCEDVCSYVRFWPDHGVIRRELTAHMEDSMEELTSSGLGEEEAERVMLSRMGNPAEVGRQLNAVHSPRLGWLWLVSKWITLLCLAAVIFLAVTVPNRLYLNLEELSGASLSDSIRVRGCRDYSDGFLFVIDQAAFWENGTPGDGLGTVKLRFTVWDVIGNGGFDGMLSLFLVDSHGQRHDPGAPREGSGTPFKVEAYYRVMSQQYILTLEGVSPDTNWVELRCTQEGRDLVLHVELPGGEAS